MPGEAPTPRSLPTRGGRLQQLRDRGQIWLWERIMYRIAAVSSEPQQHRPPEETDLVKPIPAGRRYPWLGNVPLIFSEETPLSERHPLLEVAVIRFMLWLKEWYALGDTLTQVYTDVGAPYPERYARLQPVPVTPDDFQVEDKLAGIARRGPFSLQTRKVGDLFEIDLSALEPFEPRAPFIATGGRARFERDGSDGLRTLDITFRGQTFRPGQPGWTLAERRFLAALNTNTTVVEHLVRLHIATAGVFGIVARTAFSTRHPLRILMQPFSEETNRVNNYNIDGLILSEHSNVPIYSGYSLEQASTIIREAARTFDIRLMDPEIRAREQGQLDDPTFPTVNSAVAVYRIFHRFMRAWCEAYLSADQLDLETRIFVQELDFRVANGVRKLLGIERWDELKREHVAQLLAIGAFAGSVGHHIVNDLTREYFMSFHLMPPALNAEGHPTLGVVLEKQSSIFEAGIMRYRLLSQPVIPDERGRALWSDFQNELRQYEASHPEFSSTRPYLIYPSRIASSIHA